MLPKTRRVLRAFEKDFFKFLQEHENEFLEYERLRLDEAFRLIVRADTHLFHLQLSHKQAKDLEDVSTRV